MTFHPLGAGHKTKSFPQLCQRCLRRQQPFFFITYGDRVRAPFSTKLECVLCIESLCILNYIAKEINMKQLFIPVLLSTLIMSRCQAKPATLLIPIDFSFPFRGGGALRYSVPKWILSLKLIMWGVVFTACVVFST